MLASTSWDDALLVNSHRVTLHNVMVLHRLCLTCPSIALIIRWSSSQHTPTLLHITSKLQAQVFNAPRTVKIGHFLEALLPTEPLIVAQACTGSCSHTRLHDGKCFLGIQLPANHLSVSRLTTPPGWPSGSCTRALLQPHFLRYAIRCHRTSMEYSDAILPGRAC